MLTEEQRKLKQKIKELREEVKTVQGSLSKLLDKCGHNIIKKGESAVCVICDQNLGWWCPGSPDYICEYFDSNEMCFSEYCIFCHQPSERK